MLEHAGGCLCGAVRYRIRGDPARYSVCHCRYCQRRTGSAFGLAVIFNKDQVEVSGTTTAFEHRSDESGRWLKVHFCPRCGTTVVETTEKSPGTIIVQGGTFDNPDAFTPGQHIWARSAQHWVPLGDIARHEKSYTA